MVCDRSVVTAIFLLANMYAPGQYSITAKVAVVVTAASSAVAAALFLFYNMFMLKHVKRRHEREIRDEERRENGGDVVIGRERGQYTRQGV
jgi:membrane protein implicated in regulation of membrane protease activity